MTAFVQVYSKSPVATSAAGHATGLGIPANTFTGILLIGAVVFGLFTSISGVWADRIGRRRMYLIGAAVTGLFGFLYFGMLDTAIPSAVFIAIVLSLIPHDIMYGPQAALIAEAFTPRLRYSGASLGYQLASIVAGGPAPFIATWLFATYQSTIPIGIYISICAVISIAATLLLPDYTNKDIALEHQYGNV